MAKWLFHGWFWHLSCLQALRPCRSSKGASRNGAIGLEGAVGSRVIKLSLWYQPKKLTAFRWTSSNDGGVTMRNIALGAETARGNQCSKRWWLCNHAIEVLCLMSWSNNGVQLLNSHCLMLLLMLLMRNWRQPFFLRFISLPREDVMNQTESVQLRSKWFSQAVQ